jgi:tetratricopeptide (TPR) repeat protein
VVFRPCETTHFKVFLIFLLVELKCVVNMKKVFALVIPTILLISAIAATPVMAGAQISPGANDSAYAKKILDMADNAKLRVETLIGSIRSNSTLISNQTINSTILSIMDNTTGAFTNATNILQWAHGNFTQGNYTETVRLSLESMQIFREIYATLSQLIGGAGEGLQGQGLLVAMNCTLDRLQKMNDSLSALSTNIQTAMDYLNEAKKLLNLTEATLLLQQGNVSEVAHRLAEANRLMNQATQALKLKAQEKAQVRIDQYLQKLERNRERIMERLNATGINATELFAQYEFRNMGEFNQAMNSLQQMVRAQVSQGQFKKAYNLLNSMANLTQNLELRLQKKFLFPAPILPSQPQGKPGLQVSVEKLSIGSALTLVVTVNNTGNATIVFPNSAFGITIEKKSNGEWVNYYTPISAQVLVSLKPGEIGKVQILLSAPQFHGLGKMKVSTVQPASGEYRVTAHGWVQGTYEPVSSSVEFSIP